VATANDDPVGMPGQPRPWRQGMTTVPSPYGQRQEPFGLTLSTQQKSDLVEFPEDVVRCRRDQLYSARDPGPRRCM
jgi:hypothetical protein